MSNNRDNVTNFYLDKVAIFMCYSDIKIVTEGFRQRKRPKNTVKTFEKIECSGKCVLDFLVV